MKRDAAGKRIVVGTEYRRGTATQNELTKYIADHTPYRTTFRDIHELAVDGKRVLMFEIPPASPGIAMTWKGHLYGREGSSIGSLSLAELDRYADTTPIGQLRWWLRRRWPNLMPTTSPRRVNRPVSPAAARNGPAPFRSGAAGPRLISLWVL